MSSLPPWKNVYKSGRWPDPNNNLLRACLPRHNALHSKVELSVMATSLLNPFFFFFDHYPKIAALSITWPWCIFRRPYPYLFISGMKLGCLFHTILEAKHARIFYNARTAKCFSAKGDIHLLKNVTPIWHGHAGMKVKMKTYLSSALYWQKGSTLEAVIIFKKQALNTRSSFFF